MQAVNHPVHQLLARVRAGEPVEFSDTMDAIQACYVYTPSAFSVGQGADTVASAAGINEGSCRILALARIHGLSRDETLALFGRYYREDVLQHPEGNDHANIRRFMRYGPDSVSFERMPLEPKQEDQQHGQ